MRFQISKTSDRFSTNPPQPCDGAISEQRPCWHRPEETCTEWFIEINALDELLALVRSIPDQILNSQPYDGDKPPIILTANTIEIYDDYRE